MLKTVLVTGSSRGFGKLIALELARRGWRVYATMRDPSAGTALLDAARADGVPEQRLRVVALDVADPLSVRSGVEQVLVDTEGTLDAVVLNAGIASGGVFEDVDEAEFARVMATNFFGVLRVARAVLPALRAAGDGRLVVMSSDSGMYGTPGMSAYTASKFAVEGWAESIALEVESFGVKVSILQPGSFQTDIWQVEPIKRDGSAYAGVIALLEEAVGQMAGRARDPQQVAVCAARVLQARRPRLRYRIGPNAKVMKAAARFLPDSARLALIRRHVMLDRLERARR